jgi:hypothetical protein
MIKIAFALMVCPILMAGCSALSRDQRAAYDPPSLPARTAHGRKLALADIVALSRSGMHSSDIMVYLAYSGSEIDLSPQDAQELRDEGVSGDVITYLREKPNRTGSLFDTFRD